MTSDRSLTDEQIRAIGMDPAAPFSTCPRTQGEPFTVRHGDNRIVRSSGGDVSVFIGYYSDEPYKRLRDIPPEERERFNAYVRKVERYLILAFSATLVFMFLLGK